MNILNLQEKNCASNKMKNKILERKVAKTLYIFAAIPDKVEKYAKTVQSNSSANSVHHYSIDILNIFDNQWSKTN